MLEILTRNLAIDPASFVIVHTMTSFVLLSNSFNLVPPRPPSFHHSRYFCPAAPFPNRVRYRVLTMVKKDTQIFQSSVLPKSAGAVPFSPPGVRCTRVILVDAETFTCCSQSHLSQSRIPPRLQPGDPEPQYDPAGPRIAQA